MPIYECDICRTSGDSTNFMKVKGMDLCQSCYRKNSSSDIDNLLDIANKNNIERQNEEDQLRQKRDQVIAANKSELDNKKVSIREKSVFHDLSWKDLFYNHINKAVMINYDDPIKPHRATLIDVNNDFFTVSSNRSIYHFPYRMIISVQQDYGVSINMNSALTIIVYHTVIYKGSIGLGLAVPLPDS